MVVPGAEQRRNNWLLPILVFFIAAVAYGVYGLEGALGRDQGIYLYAGQRVADGVPPYLSIFDRKSPLAYILPGMGVLLARTLGTDDIYTVRVLFYLLGCLTPVGVYFLGNQLFKSPRAGIFGALTFLGFSSFAMDSAYLAPEPKTALVLFQAMNLYFASKQRWFWAGLFGSLCFLIWQPMVIFPLVTLALASVLPRKERISAMLRAALGFGLPLAVILVYFLSQGALEALGEGVFLFSLRYHERPEMPFLIRVSNGVHAISSAAYPIFPLFLIGILMILYLYYQRRYTYNSLGQTLAQDRTTPLLFTFPLLIFWSIIDFQGPLDGYIFLPYAALGFGWFLDLSLVGIKGQIGGDLAIGVGIVLIISALVPGLAPQKGTTLLEQRVAAREIIERFGEEVRIVSIGAPEIMVILNRVNPTRYLFIVNGRDRLIQDTYPGGFEGWLQELAVYDPEVIVFGPTWGDYTPMLMNWLRANYHRERIGPWRLWVGDNQEAALPLAAAGVLDF